jgi:hypothetical protein
MATQAHKGKMADFFAIDEESGFPVPGAGAGPQKPSHAKDRGNDK